MTLRTLARRAPATGAALGLLAATAACGGGEDTAGAGEGGGVTVQAAEYTWTAAALTNAVLQDVVEANPELGVAEIETTQLDPAAAWTGAQRGDIDLITEVALPNQGDLAAEAEGMEIVSETYGGAEQGWFVPSYVVEPGGPAEGLTSVEQLPEYAEVFDSTLYDADPGWVTTEQNRARLAGYGLDDWEHVVGGEAAELAQVERSVAREEPILAYLYRPHAIHAQYDLTLLEESTPYEEGCFAEGGDGACAMPAYSANIAASTDLAEEAPQFVAMLEEFAIPLEEMEEMQAAVEVEGLDVEEVAAEWVEGHQEEISSWIPAGS